MDRRVTAAFALLAIVAHAHAADGQSPPSIDARTWRPSTDAAASFVLEPPTVACRWCWNFGAWMAYADNPLSVRDGSSVVGRAVAQQVTGDLTAGLGIGARTAVGIDLPFVLWQDATSGASGLGDRGDETALGDLALVAKTTIVSNEARGIPAGFGLAAIGDVTLPTGSRTSTLGEGEATVGLRVLGEYAIGPAALRASLGFVFRPYDRTWAADLAEPPVTFGDSLPWAVSLTLRPKVIAAAVDRDDRQQWEIAASGALPAGPVAPFGHGASWLSPALLAADDRVAIGKRRDFYVLAAAQIGLDDAVGVPAFRGVLALGWTPRVHDRDADGVPDDVDQCPDLPEDRDGIQDEDGCPEDDADGDGIPDDTDACPLVAGKADANPRKNGCP